MWSLESAADAERDFELTFDHLVESYLEFGEDRDVAFERAVERIRGIQVSANKPTVAPKQGTLRLDILVGLRFVRLEKTVFWSKAKRQSGFWPSFLEPRIILDICSPGCLLISRNKAGGLQPRGLGQVHPESVSIALIPSGHFWRGVAELFLDVALIDIGAGR